MPEGAAIMNAKGAISRHIRWKITLQLAITLEEPLSPEHIQQIRNYRRCAVGMWLESAATSATRSDPAYLDLFNKHVEFHREMEFVAGLIAAQRFLEAARAIDPFSSFARTSNALAMAMMAYDKVVPIAVPS